MKSYSAILSGKEISRFIRLPDEFQEVDLKVTVRRINKKTDRFAKLFLNPIKVEKIEIPTKNNIHER
jgi:ethanolamine utilization protein EutP (predicted NTPase)